MQSCTFSSNLTHPHACSPSHLLLALTLTSSLSPHPYVATLSSTSHLFRVSPSHTLTLTFLLFLHPHSPFLPRFNSSFILTHPYPYVSTLPSPSRFNFSLTITQPYRYVSTLPSSLPSRFNFALILTHPHIFV